MFASVVLDDVELKPASRQLIGVKVAMPASPDDKGKVQFDRPLHIDVAGAGRNAMIGFFLTRDAPGWQMLLRTDGTTPPQEVDVDAIAGLEVPEGIPLV